MTNRADEWHIKIDPETKRRLKVSAAMHELTLAKEIKRLLDRDAASDALAIADTATTATTPGVD